MSGPGWTLPAPPLGVVTIPSSDTSSAAAKFFGEDVWFDVTKGAFADYVVSPAGDYQAITGVEALRQSLIRRIITNPGEWKTLPNFGVGARQYVKAKNTQAVRDELAQRVKAQCSADPRVEKVSQVIIEQLSEGAGLKINVEVTARGRLRTDQPVRISIGLR